ncbi:MAG: serine--tRNA ligase [Bacteroidota bacterium]
MLSIRTITEQKEMVISRLAVKNFNASAIVEEIISLDKDKRAVQTELEKSQATINELSRQIGQFFKEGKTDEANAAKEKTGELKDRIKMLNEETAKLDSLLHEKVLLLPNIPHESVPAGKSSEQNLLVRTSGEVKKEDGLLPHWDLAKKYELIDFELGTKITGAGFPVYKGKCAKLQRALINFFLDEAISAGYNEVIPPYMVNEDSAYGTGQLPDKEGQMYHVQADNFYLIPTAEVPVTNIFRDVILEASRLPLKYTAFTPCFRREAGSYGKDVRGLNRLHQFDKVEIVHIEHPERSYQALEEMVIYVESLVKKLELPYRIIKLCGGDLSFTSALTYDFEVYSKAQQRWLEISSVSNFESFQSNRLKLRFKDAGEKKTQLAHTLNGSALALPRIMAALMENNQTDAGIKIPKAITAYTGFDIIG